MSKLKDIASVAGVSISTVSKALNNSNEIKKETKANIIRIARELNYKLDTSAAAKAKTHSIGVICPEVDSNYYTQLVSSIGSRISRRGYSYTVAVTDFSAEKEEQYLSYYGGLGVDGIILITENPRIQNIVVGIKELWHIPIVIITTDQEPSDYDCIRIDDYQGVIIGIEYLIRLGHKKIAYIGDLLSDNRLQAYKETMHKHGLPVTEELTRILDLRFEACGYQGMKALLQSGVRPTAVFGAYDDIAIGALRAIGEHKLTVPDDISVIGMDDVLVCPYLHRALTTVSNPIKEMAAVSISILAKKIEDKAFTVVQNVALKPTLVVRETTREYSEK